MSFACVITGFVIGAFPGIRVGLVTGRCLSAERIPGLLPELFRPILPPAWFGMASLATLFGIEAGPAWHCLDNLKLAAAS